MNSKILKPRFSPAILASASVVGKKEHDGPLGEYFDYHDETDKFGQKTWEQSEASMQHMSLNLALAKLKQTPDDIDAIFAGDLINQCTSAAYGLLSFDVPYFGLYGACSTVAEGLILATLSLNSGCLSRVAVTTSSHNCSAERQFRYPLEYGSQRTPTSQWTVTGSASFILGEGSGAYITELLPGRSVDNGITDANNMGAAMAPAAVDTLTRYFKMSDMSPSDFDGIFTGDLGFEGHAIVTDLMRQNGIDLGKKYNDCGLMIYDREKQDMHAGGSGCGCSASVLSAYLLKQLQSGELKDILFIATGALMSPMLVMQGQSIPGIAHLIRITSERSN